MSPSPDPETAALEYAARDWPVFPLHSPTAHGCSCGRTDCARPAKHPRTAHGLKDASRDAETIREWWMRWPDANIGMATGQPSGVFVVDVDGEAGRASVAELARQGLTLPATLTVTTGRADGGEHRYYRMPSGVDVHNDQSGRIGPHVDVRGTGGFVVCPPSVHASGKQYRFIDPDAPIADAPAWVIERLAARQAKHTAKAQPSPEAVTKGGRTNRLVSLAGTLHKRSMAVEAIEAALLAENAVKCSPPLPESKVRAIARDIPKRYPNAPKDAPGQPEDNRPAEYADDALTLKFTERHGDDLRFTAAWGRWSVWDGCAWRQDETLRVFDLARKVCREESAGCEDKRLAARIASAVTVAAVERLARADRRHAAINDQWDADPWMLNTPNGVVDLRSGELRPAKREDYLTRLTAVAPCGECPRWLAFLSHITNDNRELQDFMQRMCGYALTGVTREHALFFLYGTGANGKSVFLNTISGLMGDYAKTAPIETFIDSKNEHHPTDLAGLQGARLITAVETEDGRRWAESKLKALTGGDRIAARFMRQDFFEFAPVFKLVIAGNHKPGLRTVDEAMRRRFNLLPFTVTIPASERDPELTDKLRAEWGGILQWMLEGCLAWQSQGLLTPKTVSKATADYLAAEDVLSRWMEDRCVTGMNVWGSASALFADWRQWAEANGEFIGSQKRFSENLAARCAIMPERRSAARGFQGIRLKLAELMTGVTDSPDIPVTRARAGERPISEDPSHPSSGANARSVRL